MKQKSETLNSFLLPPLRDIVFIIVFAGALMLGTRMLNTDGDLGRDLTIGTYIINSHQIPTRDLFSFTKAGQPRPPYEWLAQILFAIANQLTGLDGVVLLSAAVIAAAFFIVYADSNQRSQSPILALLIVLWAVVASSIHWLTRPHIFSFLFFAIWLQWLERIRVGKKISLWVFPVTMLFWANTHGGFIFGFLAWGAYLAGWLVDLWRKSSTINIGKNLSIIGATSLAASVITPDTWHNWAAVFSNNSAYILSHTAETMPPNFAEPSTWPFAGLLALALILFLLLWKQASIGHIFLLAGLAGMSLLMARNIPLFAVAAAPILSAWTGKIINAVSYWKKIEEAFTKIETALRGYLWTILIVAIATGFFVYHRAISESSLYQFDPQVFPVQAADWVESHPIKGNMFNDFNWGGYLLYRLWPGQRVFVDSQSDFYGEAFLRTYSSIYTGGSNWDAELARYNVNWIIVPREAGLASAAGANPHWQVAYQDPLAIIFERR